MRPVKKEIPLNDKNHYQIEFTPYGDAKPYLVKQLGKYCSYCEGYFSLGNLAVEHLWDKDSYPQFENHWNNFLIACNTCNSIKGTQDIQHLPLCLPHLDNPLCYIELDRFVWCAKLKMGLSEEEATKARNYIRLVGLDRWHRHPDLSDADDRAERRKEIANIAIRERNRYDASNPNDLQNILINAIAHGFFSVWLTVFAQYPEVKNALIAAFTGTARDCFDSDGNPIPRNSVL